MSYRDKRSARFAAGQRVKAFSGFARQAEVRLEAATSLADLAALPGNRLETPTGDRAGQYSIRINDEPDYPDVSATHVCHPGQGHAPQAEGRRAGTQGNRYHPRPLGPGSPAAAGMTTVGGTR